MLMPLPGGLIPNDPYGGWIPGDPTAGGYPATRPRAGSRVARHLAARPGNLRAGGPAGNPLPAAWPATPIPPVRAMANLDVTAAKAPA